MTRIHSNEPTDLAYDGTPETGEGDSRIPAGQRVILHPGLNVVTDNEYAVLNQDVNFRRHATAGIMHFLNDDGAAIPLADRPRPVPFVQSVTPPNLDVVNQGAETLPDFRTDAAGVAGDRTNPTTGEIQGVAQADARKRKRGESDDKYEARMKQLDAGGAPPAELPEAVAKEVNDYFGLNAADRAAMLPALSPEAQAAIAADDRSKAVS